MASNPVYNVPLTEMGNYGRGVIPQYSDQWAGPVDAKQNRYVAGPTQSTATFKPYDGLSLPTMFGSGGPLVGDYTAKAKPAPAKQPSSPAPTYQPNGSTVANKDQTQLVNGWDQLGGQYPFGYSPEVQNRALAAIDNSTAVKEALLKQDLQGHSRSMGGIADMFHPSMSGYAPAPGAPDPWGDNLRGPSYVPGTQQAGYSYGRPSAAAMAVAANRPATVLESLANMFGGAPATSSTYTPTVGGAWGSGVNTGPGSPGWSPGVITHDWNNSSGTDVFGNSMSFQPSSAQTSSRWNTGY